MNRFNQYRLVSGDRKVVYSCNVVKTLRDPNCSVFIESDLEIEDVCEQDPRDLEYTKCDA